MLLYDPIQASRCTGDGHTRVVRSLRHERQSVRKSAFPGVRNRKGAATVEMALTLPLMLLIIFGTLEICQRLLLRQTAAVAAYETARLAARRGASATQAIARGRNLLQQRGVVGATVTVQPADITSVPTGGELNVVVYVPIAGNSTVSYALPSTGGISVVSVMLRE